MTSEVVTAARIRPAVVATIERESSGNAISREAEAAFIEKRTPRFRGR